jgi:hypothetical protein
MQKSISNFLKPLEFTLQVVALFALSLPVHAALADDDTDPAVVQADTTAVDESSDKIKAQKPLAQPADDSQNNCMVSFTEAHAQVPHGLTAEQMATLKAYLLADDTAGGWEYLATFGDKYASISAQVISDDPKYKDEIFHKMVRNHWLNTVGKARTDAFFQLVAHQHLRQYVEIMETGYWPDSDQILMSYITATRTYDLDDFVVFDEVWVKSGLDAILKWETLLGMKSNRIVKSSYVCVNIDGLKAFFAILRDLVELPF